MSAGDQTFSRRDFLRIGGAAGIGAVAAACAPSTPPTTAPAQQQQPATKVEPATKAEPATKPEPAKVTPKRGGILKIPVNAAISPWPPIGLIQNLMVNKVIFNQIVRPGIDLTPQPDLAERWETSSDGLTWTFHLRKDVAWHDERPFTADDVIASLEVYKDAKSRSIFRSSLAPIVKMEAPDRNTVKLTTNEPFSSLLEILSYLIFVMPKHKLEGLNVAEPNDFTNKPIGTGAFKFEQHVRGDHLTLVRNEKYFRGSPPLDSILFKVVPDVNNAVAQVRTGELDMAFIAMEHLDALKNVQNVRVDEAFQIDCRYLGLNLEHPRVGPWFQDKRVRQAMAHAIDRKGLLKQVTQDKGVLSTSIIPPFFKAWHNPNARSFDYNPERAKQLLAEAGWKPGAGGILEKDGQRFSFESLTDKGNTEREQTALVVQQNLKAVGIEVNANLMEFNAMMSRIRPNRNHEARTYYYVTPNSPDVYSYFACGAAANEENYCNKELDPLFLEARKVFDPEKRKAIYFKIQEILAEDQAWVFLYHPAELRAIGKRVQNFPKIGYRDALLYMDEVSVES